MFLTKIYGISWLLVVVTAAAMFLTGTLTNVATLILGFIASVLTGAGMLVIYPALMNEDIRGQNQAPRPPAALHKRGLARIR